MKTLADQWNKFEVGAIAGFSEEKRQAMRSAFYCGAHAMMFLIHHITHEGPRSEITEELNKLRSELMKYALDAGSGEK